MKKQKIYKGEKHKDSVILPGDLERLPDDFFKVVVFVDNAYLMRVKKHFFSKGLKYSARDFVETLAKKYKYAVEGIYLYDAPPFQGIGSSIKENEKKKLYDKFISRFKKEGIIVREGRTQRLKVGDVFVYRQKAVDMYLGIDLVSVPFEFSNIKGVVLISGDSDFVPAIKKLNKKGIKTILWTYFDRKRNSPFSRCNELIKAVDEYVKLSKEDFRGLKKSIEG